MFGVAPMGPAGSHTDKSMRRSATVTISAPDAAIASRVSSSEAYLPVPVIRRLRKRRPAITRASSLAGS